MTILVFGKSGQVAQELQRQADVTAIGRDKCDLSDPAALATLTIGDDITGVINAAAYTAVDKAETEEDVAFALNAAAPARIAQLCAERGIPLVHISTDYVFDGDGDAPFPTDAPLRPLGAYGRTKLAGEEAVQSAGGTYAILRTSWVFSSFGNNFVKTMLRIGADRDRLTIVADQIGGPTPADMIAEACLNIAEHLTTDPSKSGVYHFSGSPNTSWADFAREIFRQAGVGCEVEDILTSAYPTPARRPANSRLDCSATETAFGIRQPDWRMGITRTLEELK